METTHQQDSSTRKNKGSSAQASSGMIYGLGFIGAAVYYISHAGSFLAGLLGFGKAILWPGFLVYYALQALGA